MLSRLQNPYFYTSSEIQTAINSAIRSLQAATGYWQGRFIVTTIAGKVIYNIGTLPQLQANNVTQLTMPLRISFNGNPLDPTATDDLDNGYPNPPGWQLTTTATPGANSIPQMWAPIGISYFALYPADSGGNNSLQIDGVIRAPVLTANNSTINLDTSNIPAIVSEVICNLSFKRGGVALQKAIEGHRDFIRMCVQLNGHLKTVGPFREYAGLDRSRNSRRRDTLQPVGRGMR